MTNCESSEKRSKDEEDLLIIELIEEQLSKNVSIFMYLYLSHNSKLKNSKAAVSGRSTGSPTPHYYSSPRITRQIKLSFDL